MFEKSIEESNSSNKNFMWLLLLSAVSMLGLSMWFSILGMSSLFSGRSFFTGMLAGSLEFSKIIMTSHLTRNWKIIRPYSRALFIIFITMLVIFSSIGIYSYLADSYQMTTFKIKSVDLELSTYSLEESMMIEEKEDLQSSNKNIDSQINNIKETNFDLINHRLKLQESMNADTTRTVNWYASIARCNKDINDNTEELGGLRNRKKSNILRISEINSSIRDIWKSSNSVETSEDNSNAGPLRVLASMFNVGMGVIVRWILILIVLIFDPIGIKMIVSFNELQRKRFTKNEKVLESSSSEEIKHNDEQQGTQEVKVVEPNVERSVVEEVNVDTPDADDSKVGESNIYDEVITDGVKDPAEDKPVDHVVEKLLEELPDIKDRGSKLDVFVSPDGGTRLNV